MKPKLPCCEINKNCSQISKPPNPELPSTSQPQKTLECDRCECVFEKKEQLDDLCREIHKVEFTGKRKLRCCDSKRNKRLKTEDRHHSCNYCECAFQNKRGLDSHMQSVHQCPICRQVILTQEIRAQHKIKHEEEKEEIRKKEDLKRLQKKLQEKLQEERDEDLVLNYVETGKLDEYQPAADYEPDFYNIFHSYGPRMEEEELLKFVQKFDVNPLEHCDTDSFTSDQIIYLLENGAVSIKDVAEFLYRLTCSLGEDEILSELMTYFLDKGYDIEIGWVARAIEDDALMERIKQKYTYTFKEVYEAREQDSISVIRYPEALKKFYVQVHKHFPDPDFEDPFADPFEAFKRISTVHVHDHLQNRYFYDEEHDELSIVIDYRGEDCEIWLGSCKEMLSMNLADLIKQYNKATAEYDEANDKVSELFAERSAELDAASTEKEKESILDDYYYLIYKDGALSERNHIANQVSKLYFVIAQK